jgi:hypothetical protein
MATLGSHKSNPSSPHTAFLQMWPQFEEIGGERRMVGLELERTPGLKMLSTANVLS